MKAILLALVCACSTTFAHESKFHVEFAQATVEMAPEDVQSLIDQSHEIVEGDESGSFWQRWKQAFDFKTRAIDGYRWSSSVGDSRYKKLALDSLFLFGLSHGTEMLSGPVLLAVGYAYDWPTWMMSLIGGGGTVISIPGMDPLCYAAFAFYAKSEKFRNGIGFLRLATVKGVTAVGDKLGLNRVLAKPDVREYLENLTNLERIDVTDNGVVDFTYGIGDRISVKVHLENGVAYLENVTVGPDSYFDEMLAFTKQFGWNARHFIKHTLAGGSLNKPYVTAIVREGGRLSVDLAPNAISIGAKRVTKCETNLVKKDLSIDPKEI